MDLVSLIQSGGASFAYLAVAGLLLGALHGLEPGHSKTMMAAFVVAVRGTPAQAAVLGVSAAVSHSIIVWVVALLALTYGDKLIGERLEPYFMMASGVIIVGVGVIMIWQIRRRRRPSAEAGHHHHHHHHHHHDHSHDHNHNHDHGHPSDDNLSGDAHAQAHARDIEKRFASGKATIWQTIGFGLVGGLIPCPAAITVLLLCLGIGQLWLGLGMVAAFSIGLALTLVLVGVAAAVGVRYASHRFAGFERFMRSAPYVSGGLILLVGLYMSMSGWAHLGTPHAG